MFALSKYLTNQEANFICAIYGGILFSYVQSKLCYKYHIVINVLVSSTQIAAAYGIKHFMMVVVGTVMNILLLYMVTQFNKKECNEKKKEDEKDENLKDMLETKSKAKPQTKSNTLKTLKIFPQVFIFFNILLSYLYQSTLKKYYGVASKFDLTGLCFLHMLKMTYLCDYYSNNNEFNLTDVLNYMLYIQGYLFGSMVTFKEYLRYVKEENTDNKPKTIFSTKLQEKNNTYKEFNISPTTKNSLLVYYFPLHLLMLFLYWIGTRLNFKSKLLTNTNSENVFVFILYNLLNNFNYRSLFYFVWSTSTISHLLINVKNINIDILRVEFPETTREISQKWNISTHLFFKEYLFEYFRKYTHNKLIAIIGTYFISALMHTYKINALVFFMAFGTLGMVVDYMTLNIVRNIPNKKVKKSIKVTVTVLFTAYMGTAKLIEDMEDVKKVWERMGYYGVKILLLLVGIFIITKVLKVLEKMNIIKKEKIVLVGKEKEE